MSTFDSLQENSKRMRNIRKLKMKNMRVKDFLYFLLFTKKIYVIYGAKIKMMHFLIFVSRFEFS